MNRIHMHLCRSKEMERKNTRGIHRIEQLRGQLTESFCLRRNKENFCSVIPANLAEKTSLSTTAMTASSTSMITSRSASWTSVKILRL